MTPQAIQAMIKAGDEQKCHVVHGGLNYFKFGSYWIVEDEGPVALRVFDTDLIRQLEKRKEKLGQPEGTPELTYLFRCETCKFDWYEDQLQHLTPAQSENRVDKAKTVCPNCGGAKLQHRDSDDDE